MTEQGRLIAEICALTAKPFVETVENHFAGYMDELGVTVRLRPDTSDEDVIALQNEMLAYFNATAASREPGFTWLVQFTRGGTSLRSLFPGDAPRSGSADLVWSE